MESGAVGEAPWASSIRTKDSGAGAARKTEQEGGGERGEGEGGGGRRRGRVFVKSGIPSRIQAA